MLRETNVENHEHISCSLFLQITIKAIERRFKLSLPTVFARTPLRHLKASSSWRVTSEITFTPIKWRLRRRDPEQKETLPTQNGCLVVGEAIRANCHRREVIRSSRPRSKASRKEPKSKSNVQSFLPIPRATNYLNPGGGIELAHGCSEG